MEKFLCCLILTGLHPQILHCVAGMLKLLQYIVRHSNIRAHSGSSFDTRYCKRKKPVILPHTQHNLSYMLIRS